MRLLWQCDVVALVFAWIVVLLFYSCCSFFSVLCVEFFVECRFFFTDIHWWSASSVQTIIIAPVYRICYCFCLLQFGRFGTTLANVLDEFFWYINILNGMRTMRTTLRPLVIRLSNTYQWTLCAAAVSLLGYDASAFLLLPFFYSSR